MTNQTQEKSGISHTNKDILFKVLSENYQNKSLEVYGLDIPKKIKQMLPTEHPVVATKLYGDNMFLLEDNWLLCLEYESTVSWLDFLKYNKYVTHTIERLHEKGIKVSNVVIAVLYTADITKADTELNLGHLHIKVTQVFLSNFDTTALYNDLKAKIESKEPLTDEDIMRFIILPLTQPDKKRKQEIIENTVNLVKKVNIEAQQAFILAGIITATNKFIDPEYSKKLKEWILMTQVARLLMEDGRVEGRVEGRKEREIEIAKKLLMQGIDIEHVSDSTGIDKATLKKMQMELSPETA